MADKSDVKLIGAWPSPFVLRARVALNVKSVEYEFLQETLGAKSELLLKSNPVHKKIPVLIHNDRPICESLIIVEYMDEAWSSGPAILPSDPYDRALARFWAAYLDEKVYNDGFDDNGAMYLYWFPSLRRIAAAADDEARKAAVGEVAEGLALVEEAFQKISKGKSLFGGDHIGYLDIAFGGYLGWLRVTEGMSGVKLINETTTPGLFKWAETFAADPTVKDVLPETGKLTEFSKVIVAKLRAAAAEAK